LNRMQLEKIREAAERVAGSLGLEIFDVEWKIGKQRLLRVYIDRLPGPQNPEGLGVTHKDCERVSDQLSVIIDVEDLVPGPAYVLEVSSPGLDRKLIKRADYERFVGRLARIWVTEAIENQNYFEGRLAGYADGIVKLDVKGDDLAVPFANIKKANLVVEL
jgi:ribosome maturation factor RimP